MKNLLFILFIFLAGSACKKNAGPASSKTLKDLLPGKWNWDSSLTTTDKSGSINIIKGDVQPGAYWQFDLNGTVLYTATGKDPVSSDWKIIDEKTILQGSNTRSVLKIQEHSMILYTAVSMQLEKDTIRFYFSK